MEGTKFSFSLVQIQERKKKYSSKNIPLIDLEGEGRGRKVASGEQQL